MASASREWHRRVAIEMNESIMSPTDGFTITHTNGGRHSKIDSPGSADGNEKEWEGNQG